ncbi:MAG TPA: hypothetical protein VFS09_12275 [Candidatus Eisenbacteria bacterium]|nr:hypothetical protein [Candidatus Eisenbacteria bacterium]
MRGAWMAAASLLASLAALAPPAAAKDAAPRTHVAVFDSVASMVAAELLTAGSIPAGRPVELSPPVLGDTLTIFEQRVLQRLRADGIDVRVAAAPTPVIDPVTGESRMPAVAKPADGTLQLGLRVESKTVVYTGRRGKFPTGTKGYDRLVALQAQARLVDAATGEVLWARTASKSAADFVKAGDARAAASGTGLFAPSIPQSSGFGFLEPLLVSAVVVGLVVLFYSNRT